MRIVQWKGVSRRTQGGEGEKGRSKKPPVGVDTPSAAEIKQMTSAILARLRVIRQGTLITARD